MKLLTVLSIALMAMETTRAIGHRKKPGILDYASSLYSDFAPKISHFFKIGGHKGGGCDDDMDDHKEHFGHKHGHHKKTEALVYNPYFNAQPGYFDHFYNFPHYANVYSNYFPYHEPFVGHVSPYLSGSHYDSYGLHEFI